MKFEYTRAATTARWAGDFIGADTILPIPGKLDAATVTAQADGRKYAASGTVVGRTYAERAANAAWGLAADTDDEVFIVTTEVYDAARRNDIEFYRPGKVVKENFLPDFAGLSAAVKAKIRSIYVTEVGVL